MGGSPDLPTPSRKHPFSFVRSARLLSEGKVLDGLEGEISKEMERSTKLGPPARARWEACSSLGTSATTPPSFSDNGRHMIESESRARRPRGQVRTGVGQYDHLLGVARRDPRDGVDRPLRNKMVMPCKARRPGHERGRRLDVRPAQAQQRRLPTGLLGRRARRPRPPATPPWARSSGRPAPSAPTRTSPAKLLPPILDRRRVRVVRGRPVQGRRHRDGSRRHQRIGLGPGPHRDPPDVVDPDRRPRHQRGRADVGLRRRPRDGRGGRGNADIEKLAYITSSGRPGGS